MIFSDTNPGLSTPKCLSFRITAAGVVLLLSTLLLLPTPAMGEEESAAEAARFRGPLQGISLLGVELYALPRNPDSDVADRRFDPFLLANQQLIDEPDNPENKITLGVAHALSWRYKDAIDVYTRAIGEHPDYAPLYRHRGHRYITLRQFDKAIVDLSHAAELDQDDFDIWYHLGLAHYLSGDYDQAVDAYYKCGAAAKTPDDRVAVGHWIYMALRRKGDVDAAESVLKQIPDDIEVNDNVAYRELILFYKGLRSADDLLAKGRDIPLDAASYGYAIANWHLYNGRSEQSDALLEQVLESPYWPAFGFIASEVELARKR